MAITRITAVWSNFRGAPGYSNFFFGGAPADEEAANLLGAGVRGFFSQIGSNLPFELVVNIDPVADIIDEASGNITEQMDLDAPQPVEGAGSAPYSAATGAVVNWNTANYINGRRVRGRTFLVPLSAGMYDEQGDLTSSALSDIRSAANYLISGVTALPLVVWSRPVDGSGGIASPVTSATVPDMPAVLRSRRD